MNSGIINSGAKNTKCVVCFENAKFKCRNGKGCTALLCFDCIGELHKRSDDNCPCCRRLFFKPEFTKIYQGKPVITNKRWVFTVGLTEVHVIAIHDGNIQGEAYCTGADWSCSTKYADIEKLERFAVEIPHLIADIADDARICIFAHNDNVIDLNDNFEHIKSQLGSFGETYGTIGTENDFFALSGSALKKMIQNGFFF